MPIFKYLLLTGTALMALIVGIDLYAGAPAPVAVAAQPNATTQSLSVLRKMAHHGENGRNMQAHVGPMLPVVVPVRPVAEIADAAPDSAVAAVVKPAPTPVPALEAQARMSDAAPVDGKPVAAAKPVRKKLAAVRKPAPTRTAAVDTARDPFSGFNFFAFR